MCATSLPEGRLPGRISDSTGLPEVASKILIGWKQVAPTCALKSASSCWPCAGSSGFVDIEHDALGHALRTLAEQVNEPQSDPLERAPFGHVLEPGQRRLAHQVEAALGGAAAGDLERRIGAQRVEVVAVFISGRDRHHA